MTIERQIDQDMKWLENIDTPRPSTASLNETRARVAGELAHAPVDEVTRANIKRAVRAELRGRTGMWAGLIPHLAAAAAIALVVTLGWSTPLPTEEQQLELILAFEASSDPELADIASELNNFENWQTTVDLMLMLDSDDALQDTLEPYYLTDDLELNDDPV